MITDILDRHTGESSLCFMDNEKGEYLEVYFKQDNEFDDNNFVFLNDYDCKMLIGLLTNYLQNKNTAVRKTDTPF